MCVISFYLIKLWAEGIKKLFFLEMYLFELLRFIYKLVALNSYKRDCIKKINEN